MTETFKWRVQVDSSGEGTLQAIKIQFGEGLSQSYTEGINNDVQAWSVSVKGSEAEIGPVLAFIRAHKGASTFFWKPPLGVTGLYQCTKYRIVDDGGAQFTLSMDFAQAFAPQ